MEYASWNLRWVLWLTPRVFLGVQTLRQAAMTLLLYTVHLEAGAGASHVKVTQMICAIPTFYILTRPGTPLPTYWA